MHNDVVYSCVIANIGYVSRLLLMFVVIDHMSSKWVEEGVADSLYDCCCGHLSFIWVFIKDIILQQVLIPPSVSYSISKL
jgi:hypothetical protein